MGITYCILLFVEILEYSVNNRILIKQKNPSCETWIFLFDYM